MLQCVAVCCNVLQCVAACCRVVQCVAVRGHVLQRAHHEDNGSRHRQRQVSVAVCFSVLQCVAVYYSIYDMVIMVVEINGDR